MLSRTLARPEDPLIGRFDRALFTGPMVLIGADNALAGIVDDHVAATEAVAEGRAATWAAQVRPGVVALDVDLAHADLARLVLEDLTSWCRRRGVWFATRSSGGGPARHHLVAVPGPHEDDLRAAIEQWRQQLRLTRQALDVRAAIRPFTAPHRSGRPAAPVQLREADLAAVEAAVSAAVRRPRPPALCPTAPAALRIVPTERSGPFRLPQGAIAAGDGTRSATEFVQTLQLANSGAGIEQAWSLVNAIEGGKAARRGRSWWERYVWSKVRPAGAPREHDLGALTLPVLAAVRPAYAGLDTRQRHTLETVLVAILARLEAVERRPVPLSERDLHLATGLSRPALRAAGERAVSLRILTRTRAARRDAAWVWELGELATSASLTYPSILTPRPAHWLHACPAGTASALLDHHLRPVPRPASSTRQLQLHQARLAALRRHGVLLGAGRRPARTVRGWQDRLAQVTAERDQFYAGLRDLRAGRQAAYHRRILARRQRQLAWWHSLTPDQQDVRRQAQSHHVAGLEPAQRQAHIARLRDQRHLIRRLTRQYDHQPSQTTLPIPEGVPTAVLSWVHLTLV